MKKEVNIDRIKTSEASQDLYKYCMENEADDVLLHGVPSKRNPFVEKGFCTLL